MATKKKYTKVIVQFKKGSIDDFFISIKDSAKEIYEKIKITPKHIL
jgi:hypothetical protein